jgi:hypothetical protein
MAEGQVATLEDHEGKNCMAFCRIGILVGMFSDRVAACLSRRADVFFRQAGNGAPAVNASVNG